MTGEAVSGAPTQVKRVAVIYHYIAHYRQPVFACLSGAEAAHHYEILADCRSNLSTIATVEPMHSTAVNPTGTLRWRFIHNVWLTPDILWQGDAVRFAAAGNYDVLILLGNMNFLSTWLAAAIARLRGKRVLMWTHGILREERGVRGLTRRTFYRLSHGLLLYGERARNLLIARGFDGKRLYVVYNSLDTVEQLRVVQTMSSESMRIAKCEAGVAGSTPYLICIGRMTENKDLHLLPAALAKLRSWGQVVDLVFVGDGPAREMLASLFQEKDLGAQVHFLGEIYSEEVLCPLIAAADLCVSPGAIGLTAMHALIYGTPVITHDQSDHQKPEYEAIVPGVTGVHFRRGDAQDLAAKIMEWLSSRADREAMRKKCREAILQRYTPALQRYVIDLAVDGVPADQAMAVPQVDPRRLLTENAIPR